MAPWEFTLAELWHMYISRARVDWSQTAAVCCLIANANRDPKKKPSPFKPSDFNPLADNHGKASNGVPINTTTIGAVAKAWTGQSFSGQTQPPLELPRIVRRAA